MELRVNLGSAKKVEFWEVGPVSPRKVPPPPSYSKESKITSK